MAAQAQQTSNRVARKRARVHAEIVDAALEILMEQGVDGLTLGAVTERLDYTKPAIYHYFRSKEDLVRSLVLNILHGECEHLVGAVSFGTRRETVLGTLMRAYYQHYRPRLHAYRLVCCKFQLMDIVSIGIDSKMIRADINPNSNRIFDVVVEVLRDGDAEADEARLRALAFSAWLAAVGLVNMIGTSEAAQDPLRHSDDVLLNTLADTFDAAAKQL